MSIMNDSQKMSAELAFLKWKKICKHDMKDCERDFLRNDSFKLWIVIDFFECITDIDVVKESCTVNRWNNF